MLASARFSASSTLTSAGITATAPMRQLFGFSTELRSRTKGKAFYSLVFSRYDVVG